MKLYICLIVLASVFITDSQAQNKSYVPYDNSSYKISQDERAFLDTLQFKTFQYFINEINPDNGLVKDRSSDGSPSSIAAAGFAIPIWSIGAEKGWITKKTAVGYTHSLLKFLWQSDQSLDRYATGYNGFYYHFLDMKTGKRFWDCELSSIDSGILYCGIIFARQYFNGDNAEEEQIRNLSDSLLNRVDWSFFTLPDTGKYSSTISLGWKQDEGFNKLGWWGYTEALFLYIVSAGMNYPYAEKGYQSWLNFYQWREPYAKSLGHIVFPPMFGHQYSFVWLDMRGLADKYVKDKGIDYFENSRRAAYAQREYAIQNPNEWAGYDSLTWGLTACDGPGSKYNSEYRKYWDYSARGTSGPDSTFDDGTIAPTAVAASIPFAPEITIPALMSMYTKYGPLGLTGKYGFVDAFNPTLGWFDQDYLGIDQGPIVLMIENYFNGFVWNYFMKDPIVQKGLKRLGFEKIKQ